MIREATVDYKSRANLSELDDIHGSIENLKRTIASLKCKLLHDLHAFALKTDE
jgi:hypothetical protein